MPYMHNIHCRGIWHNLTNIPYMHDDVRFISMVSIIIMKMKRIISEDIVYHILWNGVWAQSCVRLRDSMNMHQQ